MKYHTPPSCPAPQFSLAGAVPALSAQRIAAGYPVYGKWPGILGAESGKVGHVKKFCPLLQSLAQSGKSIA